MTGFSNGKKNATKAVPGDGRYVHDKGREWVNEMTKRLGITLAIVGEGK